MFILGSQIPTFPSRAWLTWNSTDASFIQQLQSLRNVAETAEEMFGAAVCILITRLAGLDLMNFFLIEQLFLISIGLVLKKRIGYK